MQLVFIYRTLLSFISREGSGLFPNTRLLFIIMPIITKRGLENILLLVESGISQISW